MNKTTLVEMRGDIFVGLEKSIPFFYSGTSIVFLVEVVEGGCAEQSIRHHRQNVLRAGDSLYNHLELLHWHDERDKQHHSRNANINA